MSAPVVEQQAAPNPATTSWVPVGPGPVGIPTPVVNGQWVKGVGGAAVWSAITPADVGLPKITRGPFASGPPASPASGDRWVGQAVMGTGYSWEFEWNGGGAWVFLGGAPVVYWTGSATDLPVNTWKTVPGMPAFPVARPGTYLIEGGFSWLNRTAVPTTSLDQLYLAIGDAPDTANVGYITMDAFAGVPNSGVWKSKSGWLMQVLSAKSYYAIAYSAATAYQVYQSYISFTPLTVS